MSKPDSGSSGLGASRPIAPSRSAAQAGGFSASGGKTRPYAGLSTDLAAVERRSDAKYQELLGVATKKDIAVKEAMRNRTWKQSLTNDAEQAALDAVKHGKSLGLSSTEVNHDLRTMLNLRHR